MPIGSARITGPDPILDRSVPVLTSAFVGYACDELQLGLWDFANTPRAFLRFGQSATGEALNPNLGRLIANGHTDLVIPDIISRYLVAQIPTLSGAKSILTYVLEGAHNVSEAGQPEDAEGNRLRTLSGDTVNASACLPGV